MNITSWPFLISRNKTFDYRTVIAPQFIIDNKISSLLAEAAGGDLTEEGYAIYRQMYSTQTGIICLVFRVLNAKKHHLGLEGNENLTDQYGRAIFLTEGFVLQEQLTPEAVVVNNNDFLYAHKQMEQDYSEFWNSTASLLTVKPSGKIILQSNKEINDYLKIKEVKSLDKRIEIKTGKTPQKAWFDNVPQMQHSIPDEPKLRSSLSILADMLKLRKEQPIRAYNLLLTSSISLTPDVLRKICTVDSWMKFRSYLHALGTDTSDRIELLSSHMGIHNNLEGYRALAQLVKQGYFSTILTTNLDSTLEDTLLEAGLQSTAFQVLIVGRDSDEAVITALESFAPGLRIIKLRGSLREKVLAEQFPDFFEAPVAIRESLGHYLNQDIVIVGSMEHEEDMMHVLNANKKSRIHYVITRKNTRDNIIKLIEARGGILSMSLISGYYGEFETFFRTLAEMLLSIVAYQPIALQRSAVTAPKYAQHAIHDHEAHTADILLITVTEIEARAVLNCYPKSVQRFIGERAYYDFGIIGGARVFMTQSEMGTNGPGGSHFTAEDSIHALSPSAVIMVGIAFGIDAKKQHIGDILVSRQLIAYELQHVGNDHTDKLTIQMRSDRISVPIRLLDRFKAGFKTWQEPTDVYFGAILSGAKLIDNQDFRDQLRQIEQEAIGGEMEGIGLYEAARRCNVEWILVKAISDWADGNKPENKDQHQKEAASNAARFTLHMILQGDFRK